MSIRKIINSILGWNSDVEQLEAEALHSNQQLLNFDVRSRDVVWNEHIAPLERRGEAVYLDGQFSLMSNHRIVTNSSNRRQVLVCHDMMGNYLEDRHFDSSRKYDDYRFYHWSAIDYFCYFSHKYITIPPCGWINAAHKHGVKVLGTFITEGGDGSQRLHEVLASKEMVDSVVNAMLRLCKHFSFEGWLINVECPIKPDAMDNLCYFVEHLRTEIETKVSDGAVFWYDSVIATGELIWQNEINSKNVRFFRAAEKMLINYTWNDQSLEVTRQLCDHERAECQRVFFGIDIFGRGQVGKFQTKQTLARIVKQNFSTGIFAPGWVFETLQNYGYDIRRPSGDVEVNSAFLLRNDKFWWSLWDHLGTHPYTKLPFYTDFCLGSGRRLHRHGLPDLSSAESFFQLSRQSLQPSIPLHQLATRHFDFAFNGGSCLRVEHFQYGFRIFVTDFQLPQTGMVFAYAFKLKPQDGEFDCILRFCTENNARDCYLFLGDYNNATQLLKGRCYASPLNEKHKHLLTAGDGQHSPHIPETLIGANGSESDGWRVRYYAVAFDGPVQVKDIGVLYRQQTGAQDCAYLGAVYMNECSTYRDWPDDSNFAFIPAYSADILN